MMELVSRKEKGSPDIVCVITESERKTQGVIFALSVRLRGYEAAPICFEASDGGPPEKYPATTGQSAWVIYCRRQKKSCF